MQLQPKRILCVEDDEDSLHMMQVLLKLWSYEVVPAKTAADAFRLVQSQCFDLCLLDTSLPDESGVELCKRISALDKKPAVVFISGHAYESDKLAGLKAGALAYLAKPLDFDLLEEMIGRLMAEASSEHL